MTLPKHFEEKNIENILIYHYIEELIDSYKSEVEDVFEDSEIRSMDLAFLIRIRFVGKTSQKEFVELFRVSEGYTAKILRRFEENNLIIRREDPENRRQKIVELTAKGVEKSDYILGLVSQWEKNATSNMTDEEVKTLKKLLFKLIKGE